MPDTAESALAEFRIATRALAELPADAAIFRTLSDTDLLEAQAVFAEARRYLDARSAAAAREIANRSTRQLGLAGLAQRSGFRTPEALIQHATGSTSREAVALVRVGSMIPDATVPGPQAGSSSVRPWLDEVGRAIASGNLSVNAAEAIRTGLGEPDGGVTIESLSAAASDLIQLATTTNADRLFRRARELRDELDSAGIADREKLRRDQRYLRFYKQADGMTRLSGLLDPESAATVVDAFDLVTSPRRGGPRFVAESEQARVHAIELDDRTTEQLALDAFVQLIRIAAATDTGSVLGAVSNAVFGTQRPAVRVLVTADALRDRRGHGRIEGFADPVSIETVERHVCEAGIVPIAFDDDGQAINVGREQRLFTHRQRIALAARDGGCRWPGCERPPSWTEAHHTKQWHRDHGRTDVADGILLCRHHHLLLHDNHWEIEREGGQYSLLPPPDVDPQRNPILMPSTSAALRDLQRERAKRAQMEALQVN